MPTPETTPEPMTLEAAIALLCQVHIEDLETDRWAVRMGAVPHSWEVQHYVPAWEALRNHLLKLRQS